MEMFDVGAISAVRPCLIPSYCRGGSETLPKKIHDYLSKKSNPVHLDKKVTAISQSHTTIEISTTFPESKLAVDAEELRNGIIDVPIEKEKTEDDDFTGSRTVKIPCITVTVNRDETRNYSHVISTLPIPILRTIDLSGAGLNILQRNALHILEYVNDVKIGILFKSNWWTTKLGIVGGQSFTDLPVTNIVYPSYGVDSSQPSNVLIACYAKGAEAHWLGALATSKHDSYEALKELVLRNLAEIHRNLHPDVTYAYLKEEFVDMHVREWTREEYAMGKLILIVLLTPNR